MKIYFAERMNSSLTSNTLKPKQIKKLNAVLNHPNFKFYFNKIK